MESIREAARRTENLMPRIIDARRAMVTLGEISDALGSGWSNYRPVQIRLARSKRQ